MATYHIKVVNEIKKATGINIKLVLFKIMKPVHLLLISTINGLK